MMDEIQKMIDTPHISSIAVDPGNTNNMITGESKDYGETGEGLLHLDLHELFAERRKHDF